MKRTNNEIQREANRLLESSLDDVFPKLNYEILVRSQEDQQDKGIDFEIEVLDRTTKKTITFFKAQNKGTLEPDRKFKLLKSTKNKGLRSWQIETWHVDYYKQELPAPVIYFICDLQENKVYWHPIQLDKKVDIVMVKAQIKGTDSVQIYIDPENVLNSNKIETLINDIKKSYQFISKRFIDFPNQDVLVKKSFEISLKGLDVIDELNEMINLLHGVKSTPTNTIAGLYPLSVIKENQAFFNVFELVSTNEKVWNFFNNLKEKSQSFDVKTNEKLNNILSFMSNNLIWFISFRSKVAVDLRKIDYQKIRKSDFIKSYWGFKFTKAATQLKKSKNECPQELLKKAFQYSKFGVFKKAVELFFLILEKHKSSYYEYFISLINLKSIIRIAWFYFPRENNLNYYEHIENINIREELISSEAPGELKELIFNILNKNYLHTLSHRIESKVLEVEEFYFHTNKGGSMRNSYPDELNSFFTQFLFFLYHNHILFDDFKDFRIIANRYIEGTFALYSIKDSYSTKILKLQSIHSSVILHYGAPKFLKKCIVEYSIQKLKVKDEVIKDIRNVLLSSCEGTNNRDITNSYFKEEHFRIIHNCILLFSVTKFNDSTFNELFKLLLSYMENNRTFNKNKIIETIQDFIRFRGDLLTKAQIIRLIEVTIGNQRYQDSELILDLIDKLSNKQQGNLCNNPAIINKIISIYNKDNYRYYLAYLWLVVDDEKKEVIEGIVKKRLNEKFDSLLYRVCASFEIIKYDVGLLNKLFEVSFPKNEKLNFRGYFFDSENEEIHRDLNNYLSLVFKYDHQLGEKKEKITNLSLYYEWLFDMVNFNYSKFKFKWVTVSQPKEFYLKMKKVPKLKVLILDKIRRTNDKLLTKIFLKWFID